MNVLIYAITKYLDALNIEIKNEINDAKQNNLPKYIRFIGCLYSYDSKNKFLNV